MLDPRIFENLELVGGFLIVEISFTSDPILDALDREAVAKTRIIGSRFTITLKTGMVDEQMSVSLYHEILEAATVAATNPPRIVEDFTEADFEAAAIAAHKKWGLVSCDNLNRMLQSFGF